MGKKIKVKKIKAVNRVAQVYSGKPGCACGCRGKYYPNNEKSKPTKKEQVMIKRVHKLMEKGAKQGKVYSWRGVSSELVVLDTSPSRTYTLYYKKTKKRKK